MSLLHSVVDAVQKRSSMTTRDLMALFPGIACTRVQRAAQNAAFNGYIRNVGTNRAAVWEFVRSPAPQAPPTGRPPKVRPVSSVFEMGERIASGRPCWMARVPRKDFERAEA